MSLEEDIQKGNNSSTEWKYTGFRMGGVGRGGGCEPLLSDSQLTQSDSFKLQQKVYEKPRTWGKGRRPPGMTQSSQRRESVS
jgi:hypothetical protein